MSASVAACSDKAQVPAPQTAEPPPEEPPEFVFVPAPGFQVKLIISLPARVKVGEPVRLRARRESTGQWHKVRTSSLPPESQFFSEPGPAVEAEVAANISWYTDPPRSMKGDLGLRSLALGMEREAVFGAPGVVQVWAVTTVPLRQKSNVIEVTVEG